METQPQQPVGERRTLKILYWVAAAAMTVAGVMELVDQPDYLKAANRFVLVIALVLLATARPTESRAKKLVIYALLVLAIGLLLARLLSR